MIEDFAMTTSLFSIFASLGDGGRVDRIEVCHGYCTRTLGSTSVVAKSARIAPIAKITEP